jgi:hypothetical protein
MNCANHPETPVAAYCQFCGKPLCTQCIHKVGNVIACEPCLAARVGSTSASPYTGPLSPADMEPHPWGTEPWIAFVLGLIPGVGAMYNGQVAKGLAHVVIFALLVDLTHFNGLLGLLVAAWIFYQVFDAYQTAVARRDGLPLPNPLGLNNIGQWFVVRNHTPYPVATPATGPVPSNESATAPSPEATKAATSSGFASEYASPYIAPSVSPTNPHNGGNLWHSHSDHSVPTGAVILIVLGVLFLLSNLGILSGYWIDRGWPILLIALGIWIIIRRSQTPPSGGVR